MFDFVRRHQRIFLATVLLLIIPSFVVIGAWDLIAPGADANTVAVVGKDKVQYRDWEQNHQRALQNASAQFGGRLDPKLLDTPASRQATLNDLINERVLVQAAIDLRVRVSDEQIRQSILAIPAVQKDGRFDMDLYQRALKAQGLTPETFEQSLRQDIMMQVLPASIARTTMAPRSVARVLAQAALETRTIRFKRFPVSEQMSGVSVTDAEVEAFYQANQPRFQTPEQADIALIAFPKPGSADQVEQFSNIVYEQSDSLEPASKKLGMPIQTIEGVTPRGLPEARLSKVSPEALQALSNSKLLAALFSKDALADKRNTEAIELAPGVLARARVLRHRAAAPIALDSVRGQIEREIRLSKAADAASKRASAEADKASASVDQVAGLSGPRVINRPSGADGARVAELPSSVLRAVMEAKLQKLPSVVNIPAGAENDSAWLVVITQSKVPEANSAEVNAVVGREFRLLEQTQAQDTLERWVAMKREDVGVKIFNEKLTKQESR